MCGANAASPRRPRPQSGETYDGRDRHDSPQSAHWDHGLWRTFRRNPDLGHAPTMRDAEWLADRADNQCGLLTRDQCRAAGMTDHALQWKVDSRRWRRLHDGVYLTTPGRNDAGVTAMAAVLTAQSSPTTIDAALAGRTAAAHWGIGPTPAEPPTVGLVIPHARQVRPRTGLIIERRRDFEQIVEHTLWPPITSIPATVLDCAARSTPDDAVGWIARAVQRRRTTPAVLRSELLRRARHPHRALLLDVLADVAAGSESPAELRYHREVERAHGLPRGIRQRATTAGTHDVAYAAHALLVEVDGRVGHEGWSDRVRDGRRDRIAATAGRTTLRVFWPDLLQPCVTATQIGAALQVRGWLGQPRPCRRRDCWVASRR